MVKLSLSGSFLVHELFLFLPGFIFLFLIFILFSLCHAYLKYLHKYLWNIYFGQGSILGAMTIVVKITKPLLS